VHAVTGIDRAMPGSLADKGPWDQQVARAGPTVLLGIADANRAGILARAAQEAGFAPTLAFTPAQLLACLRGSRFDLVVLDPPFIECADPSREGRTSQGVREFLRGVVALLPGRTWPGGEAGRATWGPLTLDLSRRQAWWGAEPLELTPVQFRILTALVAAAGAVVSNGELARRVWGGEGHLDRERIFAHIRRIRKKIEDDPANPRFLLTVRGEGFRLAIPPLPH
jgi:DNA-binding response OmpR family regulator